MKLFKTIFLSLSLLSLGTISAVSVQDLLDSGQLPEIQINFDGDKYLDLTNKDLTNLEGLQNIPNIDQVKFLYLGYNQLTQLQPNTFNGLTKLRWLYLKNNQLTQLHHNTFNGLTNLEWLYLNNNQLTQLQPNTFNGLTNLRELCLYNNKLTQLQPNTFNGLTNLKGLSLYNNKLALLHPNTFNGLTNLEWLHLENNQLTQLQPNTFNGLTNLRKLYLDNNKLTLLQPNTFNGLTNLRELYLDNNKLTQLQPSLIKLAQQLLMFKIDRNNLGHLSQYQLLPEKFKSQVQKPCPLQIFALNAIINQLRKADQKTATQMLQKLPPPFINQIIYWADNKTASKVELICHGHQKLTAIQTVLNNQKIYSWKQILYIKKIIQNLHAQTIQALAAKLKKQEHKNMLLGALSINQFLATAEYQSEQDMLNNFKQINPQNKELLLFLAQNKKLKPVVAEKLLSINTIAQQQD